MKVVIEESSGRIQLGLCQTAESAIPEAWKPTGKYPVKMPPRECILLLGDIGKDARGILIKLLKMQNLLPELTGTCYITCLSHLKDDGLKRI